MNQVQKNSTTAVLVQRLATERDPPNGSCQTESY